MAGVLVAVVIATIVIRLVRRWYKASDLPPASGFTMADLRQLHRDGKMTDEEFERAKALITKAHSAQFLPPEKPKPKQPDNQV